MKETLKEYNNMNLEKLLAENMLRFGTKNLNLKLKQKLAEQSADPAKVSQDLSSGDSGFAYVPNDPTAQKILGNTIQRVSNAAERNTNKNLESELISAYGQLYTDFIQHLSDSRNRESMIIWYLKLTQDSRKAFLEQFKNAKPQIDKQRKMEYEISLRSGKVTTTTPEGAPPAAPIQLGINVSGNDVFQDNTAAITPLIQQNIDRFITDVTTALQNLQGTDAKIKVTDLEIAASASRFRNTGPAANMTWADLSKARANNVKTELVKRLTALGVIVPENVVKLKGGTNPDGTSGPNPGKIPGANGQVVQAVISVDGTYNNIIQNPTPEDINKYGGPLNTKNEYDKYKFLIMVCKLEITYEEPIPVPPVKVKDYTMEIKMKKPAGTYRFPTRVWPDFKSMPSVQIGVSAAPSLTKCVIFN